MKQILLLLCLLAAIVAGVGLTSPANAAGFYATSESGTVNIPSGKTIDSSAYLAGSTVIVDGSVQGDLYCAGETVTINGTIDGDVICGGATVTINGTVNGDIRVVGSDVRLSGVVQNNVLVAGSNVITDELFRLGGDFTGAGETMDLGGSFGRDVLIAASSATFRGTAARDVSAHTQDFNVDDNAKVAGSLWYKAGTETTVSDSNVVGDIKYEKADSNSDESSMDIGGIVFAILSVVVVAVLGVLVMPRFVHTASLLSTRDVLLAFLIGLAVIIITPIVAFVLFFTVIGIYAGFVLMVIWLVAMLVSVVLVSYYVGHLVLRKRATNAVLVAAVGSFVLSIAMLIPFVNVLVFIASLFVGVGMQVSHIRHQFSKQP